MFYPRHFEGPVAMGPGGMILGLLGFVFWVLVIWALIAFLVRHSHHHGAWHMGHNQDPVDIARARYARGEITKAEFEQLKKDLKV